MDIIKEHLIYKNTSLTICMSKLTPQEQYECVRLILASSRNDINICTHENTNSYINNLLKDLNIKFIQCWQEDVVLQTFDLHKG